MTRWWRMGLLGLALMAVPLGEASAQGEAAGAAEGAPALEQPGRAISEPEPGTGLEVGSEGAAADEVAPDSPAPTDAAASGPIGVPLEESNPSLPAMDDLAPGADIVAEGEALTMQDAVALAIHNGLDVEVERYGPLIAEADAAASWGAYDPVIGADVRYDVTKSPNTFAINPIAQNRDRFFGGGAGVTQLIPYIGAQLSARFDSSSRATRSRLESFDQRYDSSFFLNASVPLMRNLVWNNEWTNVKLAGLRGEESDFRFNQVLMDAVQRTVNRYWGLVASRDRVRVAQKSLETARALLDQTRTQYEVGVVSQVEVVEAEAGVANREFELIQSANQYRNDQDLLIEAVFGTRLEPGTVLQIRPTEDLKSYRLGPVSAEKSVAKAFESRPELKVAQTAIRQDEVDLKYAKSQRLPQLDAVGRYGYVGIAGNGNKDLADFNATDGLPAPVPVDRNYGESVDDFFQRNGSNNWRVGGVFSVPVPNTGGRRRVERSEFELRRSKSSLVRLEQGIILEVRQASRTLLSAAQRIEAAERRRLAAEEQLRAERIRLEHGESTPFEVLQREEDLVEAESQKINALQLFHAAETALRRSEGTILEANSIQVDAVRAPVR